MVSLVDELAADIGRLRRSLEPDTGIGHLADRIAGRVETLASMLRPSAGELVASTFPGDAETIAAAIDLVDAQARRTRTQLGWEKAA